jgi:two-component system, OmpR family, sensor histidine kinase SenX3
MSTSVVLLALAVGAFAGVAITLLILFVIIQRRKTDKDIAPELPRGVYQAVSNLEGIVFIVDKSMNVHVSTKQAMNLSLVAQQRIQSPELILLAETAFRDGDQSVDEITVMRGPLGDNTMTISAKATVFRERFVIMSIVDRGEYQRLDDIRKEFVANVSHELKTPISSVGLLAEALQEGADDPKLVRHFAERLTKEAQRLGDITREIIELSHLQAEGALAEFKPVSVEKIINKAIEQNAIVAKAKSINLVSGGDLGAYVYGDSDRLAVALNNLMSNAITYSPENSQVGIGVVSRGPFVEISIADQGIGMTKEETERVFERFYRTDQARSRTTGGTGLGLAIVKHIIAHHGGDIRVWSALGKGSTFTLRIPEAKPPKKGKK